MKILNILWGFSTGGIGKCFLTYNRLQEVDSSITIDSVCIDIKNKHYDRTPISANKIDSIVIKNSFDISWIKQLTIRLKETKPDIIFCHGFNGPIIVSLVKLLSGDKTPMVCTYHGLYHAPTTLKRILAPIYNNLQTITYRLFAQKVILVEKYSRDYLLKKGVPEKKLITVYNGIPDIEISIRKNCEDENQIKLCVTSRLDKVKGIEYLIMALPIVISKTKKKIKLYIVGDGTEYNSLLELVNSLQLQEVVDFKGYQSDINYWLDYSDIFLLPSLFEYHSIAMLEAMRAGKPIIATTVGGNPESIRDSIDGILVPSKDSNALAEALKILIEYPELRYKYGQNARNRFLEHFTEEKMMMKLISVFKSLK